MCAESHNRYDCWSVSDIMALVLRRSFLFAALLVVTTGQAADYTIMAMPPTKQAKVTIKLAPGEYSSEFRMPAWAPGDYEIFNYGKSITNVRFYVGNREVSASRTEDPNLWLIDGGADRVEYLAAESRGNFSPNLRVTPVETFVNGAGVFGWFKDQADQVQTLNIVHEEGMKIAIALQQKQTSPKIDVYTAKNYDILIDSPFAVSRNLRTKEFQVAGKKHVVAAFNQPEGLDLDAFASVCSMAAEGALALFGELPYDNYWFLFDVGGGGGGLEHLDSTKIGLRVGTTAQQATGIIFHEYFHAFNVKRIRSKPLGPFDYTKPAITGTIWWMEGVTDYYADVLAVRTGVEKRDVFLRSMSGAFNEFHRGSAFMKVSAEESSKRVWESRGSFGFGGVSYYDKGRLVGMALDLAIRGESGGKKSLDDVIRDLYSETKGKDGFSETRIRELCIKHGGEKLGNVYDMCVTQAVVIPIENILAGAGLAMSEGTIIVDPSAAAGLSAIGRSWPMSTSQR